MKKANNLIVSLILGIAVLGLPVAVRAAGAAEIEQNVRAAARQLYANNPEARALAREAEAVLIFPDIVKAGFVFGGSFGEGALLEHGHISGFYSTAAASYGFQAGVEKYGYALFFMDHEALSYLKRSRGWSIGAGPSVTILNKGFAKQFSTTNLQKGVYAIFFNQQGLMGGAALQGSKITRIFP
jgi:lipid-binding SYLF domain-containing protein